jgi:protease IV
MTGSIGGIIEAVNYQGLEWKIGVHEQVVKSGLYKDMLSPERELTPEERVLIDNSFRTQ